MIDEQPIGFWKKVRKLVRPSGFFVQKIDNYGLLFYERRYNRNQIEEANKHYNSLKRKMHEMSKMW